MGAVPGGRVLSTPAPAPFDVETYRTRRSPVATVHEVVRRAVVLGSTQPDDIVDRARAARAGVEVLRRRGGGGAVLLVPGTTVWVDVWLPRDDALWDSEPRTTARRVGDWWSQAVAAAIDATAAGGAPPRPVVHTATAQRAEGSEIVCFAGLGDGEVTVSGRKLVGLTQWRSRQGALVQGCAYRRWDPRALVDMLAVDPDRRRGLAEVLPGAACGLLDAGAADFGAAHVLRALPDPHRWTVLAGS